MHNFRFQANNAWQKYRFVYRNGPDAGPDSDAKIDGSEKEREALEREERVDIIGGLRESFKKSQSRHAKLVDEASRMSYEELHDAWRDEYIKREDATLAPREEDRLFQEFIEKHGLPKKFLQMTKQIIEKKNEFRETIYLLERSLSEIFGERYRIFIHEHARGEDVISITIIGDEEVITVRPKIKYEFVDGRMRADLEENPNDLQMNDLPSWHPLNLKNLQLLIRGGQSIIIDITENFRMHKQKEREKEKMQKPSQDVQRRIDVIKRLMTKKGKMKLEMTPKQFREAWRIGYIRGEIKLPEKLIRGLQEEIGVTPDQNTEEGIDMALSLFIGWYDLPETFLSLTRLEDLSLTRQDPIK